MLKICIKSYLKLDGLSELIIINDNSKPVVESVVRPFLKDHRIKYIRHSVKKGSAFSFSEGVRFSSSSIIFLAQDDLILSEKSLLYVLEYAARMNKSEVACVGGRLLSVSFELFKSISEGAVKADENNISIVKNNRLPYISRLTGDVVGSFSALSTLTPAKMLCGVFAVSKTAFLEINGFDSNRYVGNHYREETDFHLRALCEGYKILYDPRILSFHCYQKTGGQRMNRLLYEYYVVRNHALFLSRFFGFKTLIMLPLFAINHLADLYVTSRFNKIISSEYFQRYAVYNP